MISHSLIKRTLGRIRFVAMPATAVLGAQDTPLRIEIANAD